MRAITPPGQSPAVWGPHVASAPVLRPDDLAGKGRLLLVSAHPDDETLGAGRLLAWWARERGEARAILLTRGEACLDEVRGPGERPPDLAARRVGEWERALDLLGVTDRTVLGVPDGAVAGHLGRVVAALRERIDPEVGAVLAPWPRDPHPDHAAAGRAAARVARESGVPLLGYPVWARYWADPALPAATGERLVAVSTGPEDEAARDRALACFVSQTEPLAAGLDPVLPAAMLALHDRQLLFLPERQPPLSRLAPAPAALPLPSGYPRHDPDTPTTAAAMRLLAAAHPWAELDWPDLVPALVALGRTDVPLGRLVEGHVDALRILQEAGAEPVAGATYGVWASRSRASGIRATSGGTGWWLEGTLRFASGIGVLDRALVPVWTDEETHLLLDLAVRDWLPDDSAWQTEAMAVSRSHSTRLDGCAARTEDLRGEADFYLSRLGFPAGGVGVAAVWAGGAARVLDLVLDHTREAPPSALRPTRVGRMRADLAGALATSEIAAVRLATALARRDRQAVVEVAAETRAVVAAATLRILEEAKAIVGPAGLSFDADLTRAIADLDLYVRQFNADTEQARLGDGLR